MPLTPDFWSSHTQSGRTTKSRRMYSSTTRGRIHRLQFPHVHGIFPAAAELLHYTPTEFDTEKSRIKFLAVLLPWIGLNAYDRYKHGWDLDESWVLLARQTISRFIPAPQTSLHSRPARDRVHYKVSTRSYFILL